MAEWEAELKRRTTVEKIYDVALQLREPLRVAAIANRAGVTRDTAREHLNFLTELGVVKNPSDEPATYERNDAYFEWRRIERLRTEYTVEELQERIRELTARIADYEATYDASTPAAVDAVAVAEASDSRTFDDVYSDLRDWATAREERKLTKRARLQRDRGDNQQ
ncbi:hypothetical protein HSB1_47420 [Halogranum salarium B-1]|uniref:Transcriptional regulator n=1 Tax=Halogranum salarium B-1 TaxID=1210908 RepID=J2Z8I4_9EURY|nr:hypothetical protein [Halogranum salarium]EJN56925.1 hypothetical protein HSB1_47420 [Halogranum salarium B-1]